MYEIKGEPKKLNNTLKTVIYNYSHQPSDSMFEQLNEMVKVMLGIFYKVGKIRANLQGVSHK